jgi:acetyltransferase-like isoleucine patch superfamily enzyme
MIMGVLTHDWFPRELPRGLKLGERSFLYSSFAFLHASPQSEGSVVIGDDTGIYDGSFFELGPTARVAIGNYSTVVGAIMRVERELRIGNYVFIAHEVVISDCDDLLAGERLQADANFPPLCCQPRSITIADDVWIGMRAIVLAGVTIGAGAIVGAGAVVSEDVPPHSVVSGNPARVVRELKQPAVINQQRS